MLVEPLGDLLPSLPFPESQTQRGSMREPYYARQTMVGRSSPLVKRGARCVLELIVPPIQS